MTTTNTPPEPDEHQDESTRPCIIARCDGEADRIGEDTLGRPYWYCATCGTEFQTDQT